MPASTLDVLGTAIRWLAIGIAPLAIHHVWRRWRFARLRASRSRERGEA